jgi:hypothetical protein
MARKDPFKAFKGLLVAAGAEMLAPTNPYEVLRFRTCFGVGVVYQNAKGKEAWNREAQLAREHIHAKLGSLAPVKRHGRKSGAGTHQALLERDGQDCFFCLTPLGELKSVEHLVPVAHGGPNHISNKFLAHPACNVRAGHLSAPEKIRIREKALLAKFERPEAAA